MVLTRITSKDVVETAGMRQALWSSIRIGLPVLGLITAVAIAAATLVRDSEEETAMPQRPWWSYFDPTDRRPLSENLTSLEEVNMPKPRPVHPPKPSEPGRYFFDGDERQSFLSAALNGLR